VSTRFQKPVHGGRDRLSPSVLREIRNAVQKEADRYGVSKSFVISVVLAQAFGIKKQEEY